MSISVMRSYVQSYKSKMKPIDFGDFEYHMWIPHVQSEDSMSQDDSVGDKSMTDDKEVYSQKESFTTNYTDLQRNFDLATNYGKTASAATVVAIARKSGFAPSKNDELNLVKLYGDQINKEQVEKWIQQINHSDDTVQYLTQIFRKYDKNNTGYLSAQQIRTILIEQGDEDSLTVEEFNLLSEMTDLKGDKIYYENLCKQILESTP